MPGGTLYLCALLSRALGVILGFALSKQRGKFSSKDVKAEAFFLQQALCLQCLIMLGDFTPTSAGKVARQVMDNPGDSKNASRRTF